MPKVQRFEDLVIWQKSRILAKEVYCISKSRPFASDYPLRDQIRKSTISIVSNIAEGFERDGNREFIQFLSHAKGSAGELRTQLYVALDMEYISSKQFADINQQVIDLAKMIAKLMDYLLESGMVGKKFKA